MAPVSARSTVDFCIRQRDGVYCVKYVYCIPTFVYLYILCIPACILVYTVYTSEADAAQREVGVYMYTPSVGVKAAELSFHR